MEPADGTAAECSPKRRHQTAALVVATQRKTHVPRRRRTSNVRGGRKQDAKANGGGGKCGLVSIQRTSEIRFEPRRTPEAQGQPAPGVILLHEVMQLLSARQTPVMQSGQSM